MPGRSGVTLVVAQTRAHRDNSGPPDAGVDD
jgi:hypothetical protein